MIIVSIIVVVVEENILNLKIVVKGVLVFVIGVVFIIVLWRLGNWMLNIKFVNVLFGVNKVLIGFKLKIVINVVKNMNGD